MNELGIVTTTSSQFGWWPSVYQCPSSLPLGVLGFLWSRWMSVWVRVPAAALGGHFQEEWERVEGAHICSRRQSSPMLGFTPLEGCKASGPKLNRKTATICLHCYLCFKRMTGCQYKWGSLNLLPFRLLPQSLPWQVTSFKKRPMRMFPLLLFK